MNFFDRNPAGQHVSQFAPCLYIALIPIQEPSVMTHTGSFLLTSTSFNIGDRTAITLMHWKHLSSNGVHWKVQLFCADPDNRVVYTIMSGEGALQSPICITWLWNVLNIVENVVFPTSSGLMCICS